MKLSRRRDARCIEPHEDARRIARRRALDHCETFGRMRIGRAVSARQGLRRGGGDVPNRGHDRHLDGIGHDTDGAGAMGKAGHLHAGGISAAAPVAIRRRALERHLGCRGGRLGGHLGHHDAVTCDAEYKQHSSRERNEPATKMHVKRIATTCEWCKHEVVSSLDPGYSNPMT